MKKKFVFIIEKINTASAQLCKKHDTALTRVQVIDFKAYTYKHPFFTLEFISYCNWSKCSLLASNSNEKIFLVCTYANIARKKYSLFAHVQL